MGGTTPSRAKPEYWGGDVPWVVPSELSNLPGRYLTATKESLTERGRRAAGLRVIPPGSVLLTSRATIGSTAITTIPVVTNQGFQNLVAKNGTHGLWLFYCISAQTTNLERRASGSTFREISRGSVRSLPIVIPPLPEQRAIAAVLDSIDETIERTEAVITATEQLRDALRHELLTRGLPGWHSNWNETPRLGVIPADWKVVRLSEVAEIVMGQSPPGNTVFEWEGETFFDSGLPFVQGNAEFGNKFPQPLKWCVKPARVADSDAFLISVRAPVGQTNRVDQRLAIGRGLAAIRFTGVDRSYGWHAINQAKHALQPISQGSTFRAIGSKDLRSLMLAYPSLPEQQAIARVLDSLDNALEALQEMKSALNQMKVSTTEAVLTGRAQVSGGVGGSR